MNLSTSESKQCVWDPQLLEDNPNSYSEALSTEHFPWLPSLTIRAKQGNTLLEGGVNKSQISNNRKSFQDLRVVNSYMQTAAEYSVWRS
jgi:hypothetical protein